MGRRRILLAAGLCTPLAALGLGFGAAWLSHRPVEAGPADGRLRPCPDTPNCVSSEEEGDAAVAPLAFTGDPDAAFRTLVDFLRAEPRAEVRTVEDGYVHAVYHTAFFGFADDVEARLDRDAGVIHVRSASRIGYSDMGKNRERVESIRRRWRGR